VKPCSRTLWLVVLALLAPVGSLAQGTQGSQAILPLAQVRAGMAGEARTVFQGTAPESFKLRVVSVLRDFLPRQDIVLVRAEDPRVEMAGISAGMSGSPVYIDGKLMGAIAYGWSFAKEPLAGVTPIEALLAERNRPDRPPDPEQVEAHAFAPQTPADRPRLLPVAIPLSVSGASDASLAYLEESWRGLGLHPVRGGGSGRRRGEQGVVAPLVPGSAIGAALIQGDMSVTAMGTLTCTDGKQVFAFGHPMFGIGAVKLPMVQGEIHAIIPSLASSLKLASPIAEIGSITDDSKNGVIGMLGEAASKVPVEVRVTSQGKAKPPFSVEVARHRRLLPLLTTMAISTALSEAIPDVTDMVADVTTKLSVRGFAPMELRDQFFSNETLAPRVLAMSHGMHALGELLGNPFAPAIVDKVEVTARVEFRAGRAEVVGLTSSREKVRPGAKLPLQVTLRPYGGPEITRTLALEIPQSLAGKTVKIEVAAGTQAKPELPRAEDLAGFVRNLGTYFPATSLVVTLATKDDGASLRGRLIRNLPPSALDTLRPASQARRAEGVRMVKQVAFPGSRVLSGQKEITVQVLPYPERQP
jgi:hypothetical protein